MVGTILVILTGFFVFMYLNIFCLPFLMFKDEKSVVKIARDKMKLLAKMLLKILNVKLNVIYIDKNSLDRLNKEQGIIFVCNHQSNFDIPVILSGLPINLGFIAKNEMKHWPLFNTWMKKMKCIFLNRVNPKEAIKDMKKAGKIVKAGYPLVIFPEGERSQDGEIKTFKKGSFKLITETKGVVVPLTLSGTIEIHKKGSWKMKRGQEVTLLVDRPIYTENLSPMELKELNERVKGIVEKNYKKIKIKC